MLLVALALACSSAPAEPAPPRPQTPVPVALPAAPPQLDCLAQRYGGVAVNGPAGWSLALPDGPSLVWDDGRPKDADARIADPDLQDTLVPAYPTGALGPVTDPAEDPGRARVEALFDAVYGASADAVQAALVPVRFVGQEVRVHRAVADPVRRVSARLEEAISADPTLARFVTGVLGGTFNWRVVANTGRRSAHSWGVALDIVVAHTSYWEWDRAAGRPVTWTNQIPAAVVRAFEAEGFVWGGRWYHYDTMHFEYRPELHDPACRG